MEISTVIISVFLGLGLAAAAGFRVFMPLLALSVANHFNMIPLGESFSWLGSYAAMTSLGIATILEIGAYYIPWVDNILDTIAVPLAAIAGTGVMAASVTELSPMLTWGLAVIAGGTTAGAIKGASAGTRLMSSAKTAGIGNPLVSTAETGASVTLILLAIIAPIIAFIVVATILYFIFKMIKKMPKFFYKKPSISNTTKITNKDSVGTWNM